METDSRHDKKAVRASQSQHVLGYLMTQCISFVDSFRVQLNIADDHAPLSDSCYRVHLFGDEQTGAAQGDRDGDIQFFARKSFK